MNIKNRESTQMKISKIAVTLLLSSVLLAGCGVKNGKAAIKINNTEISQKQIEQMLDEQLTNSPYAQLLGSDKIKSDKDGLFYLMTEQRVVNQLIIQTLLEQEADARGIKVSSKDVDEEIKNVIDKMGGKDQLLNVLKQNGITVSQFKKDLAAQIKMKKLAAQAGSTEVSEKEAKDFYNKNIKQFKNGEQVRASHILIAVNPAQLKNEISSDPKNKLSEDEIKAKVDETIAEKKALADKIAKELQSDPSKFAQYAKKYSEDPGSAKQGGDLGFFEKTQMVPEFSKAVFAAKPNSAPGVVKTQFGYHIFVVTDRREAGTVPFEKAKADIEAYLANQKEVKILDNIVQAAKKKANIEYLDESYNPEVINKKLHNDVNNLTNGTNADNAAKKTTEKKAKAPKAPAKH